MSTWSPSGSPSKDLTEYATSEKKGLTEDIEESSNKEITTVHLQHPATDAIDQLQLGSHSQDLATLEQNKTSTKTSAPGIQVFDILMINDELDLLDIRLNELYEVIDMFFIIESNITLSGIPKPLYYKENEQRYVQFRNKIIHIVLPPFTEEDFQSFREYTNDAEQWKWEYLSRGRGFQLALEIHPPREGDWVQMSDLDEVMFPSFIEELKNPDPTTTEGQRLIPGNEHSEGDAIRVTCEYYYYSYEFQWTTPWIGPMLLRYREPDSPVWSDSAYPGIENAKRLVADNYRFTGQTLRNEKNLNNLPIFDGRCRHCSWCLPNITQVTRKMRSWGHQDFLTPEMYDRKQILERVARGELLWEMYKVDTVYVENNPSVPQYILKNADRFSYMLHRKGLANAGFLDVDPANPLDEGGEREDAEVHI
ncbi:hypothetical protein BGZ83_002514 [Gryganskiella cystojenkinii]|nr:hypothetical protein BGZ83_002514 [Gryganskiella cystojenkinii]